MLTILGCGAIGSTITQQCFINQIDFNVLLKPANFAQSPNKLLYFTDINKQKFAIPLSPASQTVTNLIVTVKAYQVETAINQLRQQQMIAADANIVLLHNGMGTKAIVEALLPKANVLLATTTYAAYSQQKLDVVQTGIGQVQIENPFTDLNECSEKFVVFNQLLSVWSQASWQANINEILWKKLFINCVINPLTAIHQVKNGQLRESRFSAEIHELLAEIYQISAHVCPALSDAEIKQTVYEVIDKTANNYSSMNRDIANNRKTEIDFISGFLLQTAAELSVDLPKHQALYQQIKCLESIN
ncbi:ketopantoate reductase family protein [Catenovulum sp. SX2]|uniref:ketopantoate reductase family protein n=1 Tax=Catenovulum sp. SX2 TaxID=3398614 RepID=UPI003F844B81